MQFKSYRICPVERISCPPCIPITAVNTKAADPGRISSTTHLLLTAGAPHNLKAKSSHGQLSGAGPGIEDMLLKVLKIHSENPSTFEVQLSSKVGLPAIAQINQGIMAGQLRFR